MTQAMRMWTYRSEVLNGHYVSQIVVQGRDRSEAVENAVKAFEEHLAAAFAEFHGFGTCTVRVIREGTRGTYEDIALLDPNEDDFEEEKALAIAQARREAETQIQPVETGRLVVYRNG